MHFSTKTDIEAPVAFVHAALTDFDGWETAALRRGAEVTRTDKLRAPGPGMSWKARFRFRGKERELDLRLTEVEPEARLAFAGNSKMLDGTMSVEMVSLAPHRTRLVGHVTVQPLTLGARLLMQSAKLARGKIQARLNKRMAQLALDIEQRYASTKRR